MCEIYGALVGGREPGGRDPARGEGVDEDDFAHPVVDELVGALLHEDYSR